MSILIYDFHELGSIPGIPGVFPAGSRVHYDTATGAIQVKDHPRSLAAIREGEGLERQQLEEEEDDDRPTQLPTANIPGVPLGTPIANPVEPYQGVPPVKPPSPTAGVEVGGQTILPNIEEGS